MAEEGYKIRLGPATRHPPTSGIWIGEVEYLSNHILDPNITSNLSLDDLTILYNSFQWRQSSMEDDLKKLKLKYLYIRLSDHTQILNLSLDDQTVFFKSSK